MGAAVADPSRPLACVPLRPECRGFLSGYAQESLKFARAFRAAGHVRAAERQEAIVNRWLGQDGY